jgi:1,4-dihydroxy-2-naphthoate octaprenyltransferase
MKENDLKYLLGPMRVPFLILAPACVLLGVASAFSSAAAPLNAFYIVLTFIGGIAAHISVNALNEYFDFKSGLDLKTQRTPFSGGSGSLPARPDMARAALLTGLIALGVAGVMGLFFVLVQGWGLLPLGLLGLLVIYMYTIWLTRVPLLCLVAPGLGFGTLMVMGAHFALAGIYTVTAFVASLVPFFLVSNLLLLNQFPDVEADQSIGRKHYPIIAGRKASSFIYTAFNAAAYLTILLGVIFKVLPVWSLLGLLTLVLAVPASLGAIRNANDLQKLGPSMGQNVLINILTPVLVAIGLFLGR